MNELVSMLVPLQGTLPYWPGAPVPTAIQELGLLVGVPLLVFIVLALLVHRKDLIRLGRGESADTVEKPLWFGSTPADQSALTGAPVEGRRAIDAGATRPGAVDASVGEALEVGGASARW